MVPMARSTTSSKEEENWRNGSWRQDTKHLTDEVRGDTPPPTATETPCLTLPDKSSKGQLWSETFKKRLEDVTTKGSFIGIQWNSRYDKVLMGKSKLTKEDLGKTEISSADDYSIEGPQTMLCSLPRCESLDSPRSSKTSKIPNKSVAISAQ